MSRGTDDDTKLCPVCQEPLPYPMSVGRPRIYCSDKCRSTMRTWRLLEKPKRSWLEGWRDLPASPTRTEAIANLEYQLATIERLRP